MNHKRATTEGADTWPDMHLFMRETVQSVALTKPCIRESLCSLISGEKPLDVTFIIKWAGVCTARLAAIYLQDAIRYVWGIDVPFVVHAAYDTDDTCREVMRKSSAIPGVALPIRHIFSDVTLGSCPTFMERLDSKNQELLGRIHAQSSQLNAAERRVFVHQLIGEYKQWILDHRHEFNHDAEAASHCFSHDTPCRHEPETGSFVFQFVSPECIGWSARGNQLYWFHPTNQSLIVWSLQLKFVKTKMFVIECTPQLDVSFIQELLPEFGITPVIVEPVEFAHPVTGKRVFVNGRLKECYTPVLEYGIGTFQLHCFRKLRVNGSVFLLAGDAEIVDYLNDLCEMKHRVRPFLKKPDDARCVLATREKGRLEGHERLAQAWRREATGGRGPPGGSESWYLCTFNLTQVVAHHKKPDAICPRPLTNYMPWSEVRKGPLVPREQWALQGLYC